ncbi:hypothetical protein [Clostridium sp. YIM B02555]|uniref:hypothetical protein n=1 Tax=Clostridium sp. YIM B02555 TaxID=2911968 RepID=UPI001EEDF07F|nr:hypothetical protein [Clostridium sp. YIM B02555]
MNIRTRKQKGEKENKINFFGEFLKIKKHFGKKFKLLRKFRVMKATQTSITLMRFYIEND